MAILLIGGTGKTPMRIARFLQDTNIPYILASRGTTPPAKFSVLSIPHKTSSDREDSSTFENPFQYEFPNGAKISATYLIVPRVADPVPPMNAFVDMAVKKYGVKIFVLLSSSLVTKGGEHVGKSGSTSQMLVSSTALFVPHGSWRTDIVAVASRGLTDKNAHNTDYLVLGPELLTHNQIAEKLSSSLGGGIEYVKLSEEQVCENYKGLGLPDHEAKFMASLEAATAGGMEDQMNNIVEKVLCRPPQNFDAWVLENKSAWDQGQCKATWYSHSLNGKKSLDEGYGWLFDISV